MEDRDRQTIFKNLVHLVDQTDLNLVLPKLIENGVFSPRMAERYRLNKEPSVLKRDMYLDITRRGPTAFNTLCDVLVETGYPDLARRLKPHINLQKYMPVHSGKNEETPSSEHRTVPTIFPYYMVSEDKDIKNKFENLALEHPYNNFNLRSTPLKVKVKLATKVMNHSVHNHVSVYPMLSCPKGYALIINNVQFAAGTEPERPGAKIDEINLRELLEGLGYVVKIYNDLGYQETKRKIDEFTKLEEHKSVDSCVIALMSHGRAGALTASTNIICYDGGCLDVEWVIGKFDNINCPNLQGKPKIFFFQTCRGHAMDITVSPSPTEPEMRTHTDGRLQTSLRKYSDMLIAYCTVPGYVSHRDKFCGTWYIQTVCEVFMNHAWNTDIEDMLKIVDQKISVLISESSSVQTTAYENRGFAKKLYFNPGLYESGDRETYGVLQN